MPTPIHPQQPLADPLTEREVAISTGAHARTTQLEQTIQQHLASEAADRAGLERPVRALTMPRVAELLTNPAFHPLDDWLCQRQADVAEVHATVDHFLDITRQAALETIEHNHE